VARPKRIALVVIAAALVVAVVALGIPRVGGMPWYRFLFAGSGQDPPVIRVSGNIEVTQTELGFKIAGRVDQRLVDEGDMIGKGQVVALLDTLDLTCEVELRRAELKAAEAALAELRAGSREQEKAAAKAALEKAEAALQDLKMGSRTQEINAAEAAKDAAETEMKRLDADLKRAERLLAAKSISREEYEQTEAACQIAHKRFRQAEQQWSLVKEGSRAQKIIEAEKARNQADAQWKLVEEGPRQESKDQAQAKRDQAEAALKLAQTRLGYARLVWPPEGVVLPKNSPQKFVVLSKNVEPGEYVAAGTPVVTIGDLVNVWLRAYINETDLGRVKVGQKARVTTDTYPDKDYEGKVSFIADQAEFTPKNVQTEKERVKLVYRIKIDLTNPRMELKPGMPADAKLILADR
jgi:HlyD family secretion protein